MVALHLKLDNIINLPDGGPTSLEVQGRRSVDIGRNTYLDWTLPDPSRVVSGRHCEIHYRDGGYWLTDISTNGTYLNGSDKRLTEPTRLKTGDRIAIGDYLINVTVEEEGSATSARTVEAPPSGPAELASGSLWDVPDERAAPAERASEKRARAAKPVHADVLDWISDLPTPERSTPAGDASPPREGAPGAWADAEPPAGEPAPPAAAPPHEPDDAAWAAAEAAPPAAVPEEPEALREPMVQAEPMEADWSPAEAEEAPPPATAAVPQEEPPAPRPPEPADWSAPEAEEPAREAPSSAGAEPAAPAPEEPRPAEVHAEAPQESAATGVWSAPHVAPEPAAPPAAEPEPEPEPAAARREPPPAPPEERGFGPAVRASEPPPAPAATQHGVEFERFLVALAAALDVPRERLDARSPEEIAQRVGAFINLTIGGMQRLLKARAASRGYMRSGPGTQVQAIGNNPLKFMPTAGAAADVLFGPPSRSYLGIEETLDESFADLGAHQMALYSAMQGAVERMLKDLEPTAIETGEGEEKGGFAFPGSRKSKFWDTYKERYNARASQHDNGMVDVFMMCFSDAYDRAINNRD